MTNEEAQLKYLGKKVSVKIGKTEYVGICKFIGKPELLSWPLQITIDRMPLQIDSLNQVSEYKKPTYD